MGADMIGFLGKFMSAARYSVSGSFLAGTAFRARPKLRGYRQFDPPKR